MNNPWEKHPGVQYLLYCCIFLFAVLGVNVFRHDLQFISHFPACLFCWCSLERFRCNAQFVPPTFCIFYVLSIFLCVLRTLSTTPAIHSFVLLLWCEEILGRNLVDTFISITAVPFSVLLRRRCVKTYLLLVLNFSCEAVYLYVFSEAYALALHIHIHSFIHTFICCVSVRSYYLSIVKTFASNSSFGRNVLLEGFVNICNSCLSRVPLDNANGERASRSFVNICNSCLSRAPLDSANGERASRSIVSICNLFPYFYSFFFVFGA